MADDDEPTADEQTSGGRMMNFAKGAARVGAAITGGRGASDYSVQHRYLYGGSQIGGRGPLGEELGYIAQRKIFQSGISMAKPEISKSGYYDQSLDYSKMNLKGLRPALSRFGFGDQDGAPDTGSGGAPDAAPTPNFAFGRPRSDMNLPTPSSPTFDAIDTTGRELNPGPGDVGTPSLPAANNPINWTGGSQVKGSLPGGSIDWGQ